MMPLAFARKNFLNRWKWTRARDDHYSDDYYSDDYHSDIADHDDHRSDYDYGDCHSRHCCVQFHDPSDSDDIHNHHDDSKRSHLVRGLLQHRHFQHYFHRYGDIPHDRYDDNHIPHVHHAGHIDDYHILHDHNGNGDFRQLYLRLRVSGRHRSCDIDSIHTSWLGT